MPRPRNSIGRAELEILNYINDHHPVSVRQVADHASKARGLVRTTVLNVMSRLCAKGFLVRKKIDGVYQYSPRVAKGELQRTLVGDFVRRTLGGSLSPFMAYLAEDAQVTDQELAQLKQLVQDLDQQSGGSER